MTYEVAFKGQSFDESWWILFAVGVSVAKKIATEKRKTQRQNIKIQKWNYKLFML